MFATKTIITLAAALSTAHGAVLQLFSDGNCKNAAGTRNVWDSTCAPTGGFSSYMITTAGGTGQIITTYSPNDCAGTQTSCNDAASLNICYPAFDSAGASNAIGSGPGCGVI